MSLTSDEVNLLIFQYLQDSAFTKTAYNFALEAQLHNSDLDLSKVPPAALINILQKGVQNIEGQNTLDDDGNVKELPNELSSFDAAKFREELSSNKNNNQTTQDSISKSDESMAIDLVEVSGSTIEIPQFCVRTLNGHDSAALICAWNPIVDYLASCSSDGTARIWDITGNARNHNQVILRHSSKKKDEKIFHITKDVTSLDWNRAGDYLATGNYDGHVRLWTDDFKYCNLGRHCGPIYALKFNENGNYLLSGGGDHFAKVWSVDNVDKLCIQEFHFHSAPILDIAWETNDTFASCSDMFIYVCKLHCQQPLIKFKGHTDEINAIEWSSQDTSHGKLLASCSDDKTLKIWCMLQDTCLNNFQNHTNQINTLKWSPAGSGTTNSNNTLILASGSSDATARIWDVGSNVCVRTLMKHTEGIFTLSFSPDAKFLATGSADGFVYVWLVESGLLVYSFKASAEIFHVTWNSKGDRIAVGAFDGSIVVLDLRKM